MHPEQTCGGVTRRPEWDDFDGPARAAYESCACPLTMPQIIKGMR